jgi:intraflagellar transport protein 172
MYKRARQYEAMLRLVGEHRREALGQAQRLVAQSLAQEGCWRDAERLYCEAGEWKVAVQMYRGQEVWEDALRVAKVYGGPGAAKQV